ncbi:MAG: hypothetical protein ACRDKL_03820 [Solirubrobacteraceae bacterium]
MKFNATAGPFYITLTPDLDNLFLFATAASTTAIQFVNGDWEWQATSLHRSGPRS